MKVYALTSSNGDGSSSIVWFQDHSIVERLIEQDPETWGGNESGPDNYKFPDGFDFTACGIVFSDADYTLENSCDYCRDGGHWPAGEEVWRCPECDAEYSE